jgi:hypothetical protein
VSGDDSRRAHDSSRWQDVDAGEGPSSIKKEFELPPKGNLNTEQRGALVEKHNLVVPRGYTHKELTEALRYYNKRLTGVIELEDDFFGASTTLKEFKAAKKEPLLRRYTVVVNNKDAHDENQKLKYDPDELKDAIYLVQDVREGPEVDKKWFPILIRGRDPANCLKHQSEAQTFKHLKKALSPPSTSKVTIHLSLIDA